MDNALDKILVPGRPHHPRVDGPVVEINFVGVPSTKFLLDGTIPSTKFLLDSTVPCTKFLQDGTVPAYNSDLKLLQTIWPSITLALNGHNYFVSWPLVNRHCFT